LVAKKAKEFFCVSPDMKRKRDVVVIDVSNKKQKTNASSKQGPRRSGYGAVGRTKGAAVTGEMKYFDTARATTAMVAVGNTWTGGCILDPATTIDLGAPAVANPLCLFVPTVGSGLNQRIGRQVKVLKLKVHGTISFAPVAAVALAETSSKIRMLLVIDQQTNSTQMLPADLMNGSPGATATINSFQNPNNFGRFRVLKDKVAFLQDPNMVGDPGVPNVVLNGQKKNFKFNINFKEPLVVHFNATNGGTVADIIDNSFHLIFGTDSIDIAPAVSYYTRVCYKE